MMTSSWAFKMHVFAMTVAFCVVGLVRSVNGDGEVSLALKPLGEQHYKPLGDAMVFTCEVEVDSDEEDNEDQAATYKLHWFDPKGQEIVDKTGRRYVEEEDDVKKLYITEFISGDEGVYRCEMTHNGRKHEKSFNLKLYGQISFKEAPSRQHQRIHTDAVVVCVVTGYPTPDVTWRYNGQRVPLGGRYTKVSNGLSIANATRSDDGNYTCRAEVETDGRMEEKVIQLSIHIPPKITSGPDALIGVEGEAISMSCRATGLPSAEFAFYKGDVQLVSTNRIQVDSAAGTVYFRPLTKSDEDKVYSCTASNNVGSDTATGSLTVQVKPSITEFNNITQSENNIGTLVCVSRGDPEPEMTFSRLDKPTSYETGDNDNGRIVVRKSGQNRLEMTINNMKPSDAGSYQCTATSNLGTSESQTTVVVHYSPVFSEDSRVEYIWAPKSRNFSCHPSAVPQASMVWSRFDQVISDNGTYRIFNLAGESLLQITVREQDQSWVYGDYECKAKNSLGESELSIELKRASVPDAPELVTVNSTTPTGIVIDIVAPIEDGGMPIIGYSVEYNDKLHDFTSVSTEGTESNAPPYNTDVTGSTADSEGNHVELENLKPSTTYVLRVRAKTEVGLGHNAFQLNVTTANIRKPYPVVISSPKSSEHSMHYHVTWNKPNTGGMPVDEYEIKYRRVRIEEGKRTPLDETWTTAKTEDKPTDPKTHYHLDKLEPDTHYELQVLAHNSIDWSEPGDEFVFHTAPAPRGVVKSSAAALTSIYSSSRRCCALLSTEFALRLFAAVSAALVTRHHAKQLAQC